MSMGKVVRPVFGEPCKDCEEQVPMARVRLIRDRDSRAPVRCTSCASLMEARHRRALGGARDNDVVIIRR